MKPPVLREVEPESIKFDFPVSNNQAEYKALLAGLRLANDVRVSRLSVNNDSQIVTSQINGTYQAKDTLLQKYLTKARELIEGFDDLEVQHVPREENVKADILSKLASSKPVGKTRA